MIKKIPTFSDLPLGEGNPPNSAWGLWREKSHLGALNWLDEANVLEAVGEIRTGQRVGLDCPLDFFNPPLLGRAAFTQSVIDKGPLVVNDDVISFNTQGSSQWDSFRHFAYQKEKKFYNGVSQADIHSQNLTGVNGLQSWAEKGIVGRGVLIDFASWATAHGRQIQTFQQYAITLEDVQAFAQEKNITFKRGDILFLRTGFVTAYKGIDHEGRAEVAGKKEWIGFAQSQKATEWLWDSQFAAVASDSPGFECRPPMEKEWHLHPILLAGWGTPIGELFDLDKLSELCEANNRWSFFVTSCPLRYQGAVASPPNAIAIM